MIDFGKLYCDLHPNEIITNFCLKETCMVGLCATCICTHTQHHIANKTTPQYQNIRATFSTMHELIRKKITSLDNQKNRIDKISQFIQTKRKTVKQNIQQTRKQAINAINNFFENKQKSMLREMESQQKKMGLHSEPRMESLMNALSRETSSLITSAQELNSQNFLESYQRIKTQTLANATKLEQDVSKQLNRNQDFQTIINSNDEYLQNIIKSLELSLQLSFKMNHRNGGVQQIERKEAYDNGSAYICQQKVTSRFGERCNENLSIPVSIGRPSSVQSNANFSTISFSNVPEMFKQVTAKFNDQGTLRQTTKSIPLPQEQKPNLSTVGFEKKSFINELYKSDIIKQTPIQSISQSQVFREKDQNNGQAERQLHQSLNKSSSGNRNHQSQLITAQKPFNYQNNSNWNYSKVNHHQSMNYSMMDHIQNQNQQRVNQNQSSQLSYTSNKCNQNGAHYKTFTPNPQISQKFNFVPQMFDPNQFNRGNQNQFSTSDCKKVRKSGLTLLKGVNNNSTSRTKLHPQ